MGFPIAYVQYIENGMETAICSTDYEDTRCGGCDCGAIESMYRVHRRHWHSLRVVVYCALLTEFRNRSTNRSEARNGVYSRGDD